MEEKPGWRSLRGGGKNWEYREENTQGKTHKVTPNVENCEITTLTIRTEMNDLCLIRQTELCSLKTARLVWIVDVES